MIKINKILFIFLFLFSTYAYSQEFGFGCLGLVGGFGGYEIQKYNPTGLNNYINSFNKFFGDSLVDPYNEFGDANGFRVGANLFRQKLGGFILTFKGFYRSLSEKDDAMIKSDNSNYTHSVSLKINHFGIGIDMGISITPIISLKIIDASVLIDNSKLKITRNAPNSNTVIEEYESNNTNFSYSIGSGFILYVIKDYISIEGTVSYSYFKINQMKNKDQGYELYYYNQDNNSANNVINNFIDGGGLNAIIQLNLGFPF